jgi:predicted DCC family thiol-disulfide oxidoreductase YuxK
MPHLVLYDGVCGLCDRFVQFLLRIDRHDSLRFAALQGPIGTRILQDAGRTTNALSTVIVVADYETKAPRLLDRSDAGLFAIASAGGIYRAASAFRLVPRFIRDAGYDLIARWRYRLFGRFDACPVPNARTRAKFLDFAGKASPPSVSAPRGAEA